MYFNLECTARVTAIYPRGVTDIAWYTTAVVMTLIFLVTLAGNAAVLVALRRAARVPTHYPLASLAIADLLVGGFVAPIAAARELFVFHLNWVICSCWSTMDVLCCTASILSLCALGWERWCGITAPLSRAKRFRDARLYAALVWPVSAAVAMPTALVPAPKHFHPNQMPMACTVNTNVGYVFFSTAFSFYLPASATVVLYARILCALASPPAIRAHRGCSTTERNNNNNVASMTTGTGQGEETGKEHKGFISKMAMRQRRATRVIVVLMVLFLVCWTPFFTMLPIDSLCDCVPECTWVWCTWLGYLSSALNPLVYAGGTSSVRRAMRTTRTTSTSCSISLPVRRTYP
ncbi:hypothetical protein ACJJTC_009412 [Scirpophaga incertulas]